MDNYFLLDKEYFKNAPRLEAPNNVNNALSFYHSIILLINSEFALIYNIFVTPIDDVKIWAYAPNTVPATCNLDIDNAPRTY